MMQYLQKIRLYVWISSMIDNVFRFSIKTKKTQKYCKKQKENSMRYLPFTYCPLSNRVQSYTKALKKPISL